MKKCEVETALRYYYNNLTIIVKLSRQVSYLQEHLESLLEERTKVENSFEMIKSSGVSLYESDLAQNVNRHSDPTYRRFEEHQKAILEIDQMLWETRKELREKRMMLREIRVRCEDMEAAIGRLSPKKRFAIEEHYNYDKTIVEISCGIPCDESTLREHLRNALSQIGDFLEAASYPSFSPLPLLHS